MTVGPTSDGPRPPIVAPGRYGTDRAPYRMTERETHFGIVLPAPSPPDSTLPTTGPAPIALLEGILRDALSQARCVITFSGGRDSSALLAVALDLARREGLPEPVPVTLRYPAVSGGDTDPGADETPWQELVIDHLRPADWERVDVPADASDLLGPTASASLRANGLLWPPALHLVTGWLSRVAGATVVTGEGGDEIFGPHRATPLRLAARIARHHPASLRPALLARMLEGSGPGPARTLLSRRRMVRTGYLDWLRPAVRDQYRAELARLVTSEPWSWADAIRAHPYSPGLVLGEANRSWLGAAHQVVFLHPFLDPGFVDAVARHGGRLGYAGRTDAMRRNFGSLLPEAVIARSTKATFNGLAAGPSARSFAQHWDGQGVDPEVVDVDRLRALWRADLIPAGTMALLQAAWLAGDGVPGPG